MHALRERAGSCLLPPCSFVGLAAPPQHHPPHPRLLGPCLEAADSGTLVGGCGELLGPPEFLEPELGFSPRLGLDPPFCTMEPGPVRFGWDPTASDLHL